MFSRKNGIIPGFSNRPQNCMSHQQQSFGEFQFPTLTRNGHTFATLPPQRIPKNLNFA
jgi:hypothetical protein